jgi:Na+/H+ antiporter NhaD/arsenite permease-like protein
MGIGILRRNGFEVKNGEFMRISIPYTVAAITTAYLVLWLIWGIKI